MHIVTFKALKLYFSKEVNARVAMQEWNKKVKDANWENFADLKRDFNSSDNVGNDRYVFNVKGNHYRIVAIVKFKFKRVFIRWVGNHKDYDRIKNINEL